MPIDYNNYPPNWKSEIVPRVLSRAGNKCEVCGLENKQIVFAGKIQIKVGKQYKVKTVWFETYGSAKRLQSVMIGTGGDLIQHRKVVLTIAHLDHDELNHDVKDDRLKAMCQYCHLNYDAKEKYNRAYRGTKLNRKMKNSSIY